MTRVAALLLAGVLGALTPAHAACPGDCNGDRQVTVDELQRLVIIILGGDLERCRAGDLDRNGRITVEELVVAINAALTGCPPEHTATPTATPPPPTATATHTQPPPPTPEEFIAQAQDFDDFDTWTPVRRFRVTNKLGRLEEAVAIATALGDTPGLQMPMGTIVQLIPGEAMVKRGGSFDPEHHGWEYFVLRSVAGRREIVARGGIETSNGSCYGCHSRARDFDYICQTTHNCTP